MRQASVKTRKGHSARARRFAIALMLGGACAGEAQNPQSDAAVAVTARLRFVEPGRPTRPHEAGSPSAAVLWLTPLAPGIPLPAAAPPRGGYTLLQKNKMFSPHLLVVPTGTVVMFPNADPFYHNVFSLFDGQRFDLGLYEAGKTRAVTFSREGVSYIFCNIHSEMGAVVIALSTPLFSIADRDGSFHLHNVPPGEYELHLWVEGEQQQVLDRWVHRVQISSAGRDLGTFLLDPPPTLKHQNKFGQPYDSENPAPY